MEGWVSTEFALFHCRHSAAVIRPDCFTNSQTFIWTSAAHQGIYALCMIVGAGVG